jgi:hypothetical protein
LVLEGEDQIVRRIVFEEIDGSVEGRKAEF